MSTEHAVRVLTAGWALVAALGLAGCGVDYDDVTNLKSPGTSIVCFGDSITRGYGAPAGRDYPAQLSALLGVPIINAGRDGDTTGSALNRLQEDVLSKNPRLVIVELSGNDFLNRVDKEEVFRNLDRITQTCANSGAMVVLVHAKFGLWKDPYLEGFEETADRHGALLVKNVLSGILGKPKLMYDQIHPNGDGYGLIAERVAEVVKPLLAESDRQRAEASAPAA